MMTPPPGISIGRSASRIISTTCLMAFGLGAGCEGQPAAAPRVEVHLHVRFRHVEREVYEDGARSTFAGHAEGLTEGPDELGRLLYLHGPLRHRLCYVHDVNGLEGLLVQDARGGLAGDADLRDGVGHAGVEACDHVGPGGSRGADVDPHLSRDPRIPVSRVRPSFLVPDGVVLYLIRLAKGLVQWQDRGPRYPECDLDALVLHHLDDRVHHVHRRHEDPPFPGPLTPIPLSCAARDPR